MGYKQYLNMIIFNPNILSTQKLKRIIINNDNKYEISRFCSDDSVNSEMIYYLLDNNGISMLYDCSNRMTMIDGVISCGKDISKLYDNEFFLELVFLLNSYYFYFDEVNALKFIKYVVDRHPDSVVRVFNMLNENSQLYVVKNCDLSSFYREILFSCKNSCAKYILDNIFSLDEYSYEELILIFDKNITIPSRLLNAKFIDKLSTIYNVRSYRTLIEKLRLNNDVSAIEAKRKKFYNYFFINCREICDLIKSDIFDGVDSYLAISNHLNCFGGIDSVLKLISDEGDIEGLFNKFLNYITTDIVIDYLFQDVSYNVFIDIRELVNFSFKVGVLSLEDFSFYSTILKLDEMTVDLKYEFLNKYNNIDIVSKFYDDYLRARRKMVELINVSILNTESVKKYLNIDLSNEYCVPIYELNGDEFYVFTRNVGKTKTGKITKRDLFVLTDGVSYSIDGSDKLDLYNDPRSHYAVIYDGIPIDQLVHLFEIDSFSDYHRDSNNLPVDNNGTDRINRLLIPSDLVGISSFYNELVISQPNGNIDEFNSILSLPKPFAIYCYDEITSNDILNAKANNLGIVVVRTKNYSIDTTGRIGAFSREDRKIKYLHGSDDIWNRKL